MARAQVTVVGAGPAGSATAWHLARLGVDVMLVDRARFPRDKPCAEYLSPEASRLLDTMGALAACEAAGAAQLAGMVVRAPNGSLLRGDFAAAHGFRGFRDRGLALRRAVLDALLLERARASGARVVEEQRVTGLVRDARGAVVGIETLDQSGHTSQQRAAIVVGADGLRSVVARRLGLSRARRRPKRVAMIAHYRGVSDMGAYGEMHVERDGYAGFADVGGGVTNVAVVAPAARVKRAAVAPAAFFDGWLRAHPHLGARLAGAERVDAVRATGPFAHHARRAWARGAALVGDAADFFDPFTGEGIYAALRGGEMLAPHIAHALEARSPRDADAALAAYDAERRRTFAGKWRVERLVALAVAVPALMNRAAATLGQRKDMADLFVGVAGDFVPPGEILSVRYLLRLLAI
ncbi:MAG TPA: FAD-dependent oxidoreductase [Gemmatimonadaceae bacterium]|nr:FAD-dependent oxidoreductase [Gemmatimonadaceae bacterium]